MAGLIIFDSKETILTAPKQTFRIQNFQSFLSSNTSSKINLSNSITDKAAQEIAVSIGNEINPEEVANRYNNLTNLDEKADYSRIKIINDKPGAAAAYLQDLEGIFNKNFSPLGIKANDFSEKDIAILVDAYPAVINELYNLPVPKILAPIHENYISLAATQLNIFKALKNYNEDPLLALLAIETNQKIVEGFAGLYSKINNLIR